MNFRTRPHFEDRQIVQYNDESINLSGTTIISPTVLDFTGTTTGQTTVDISGLVGYLNEGREYGFRVEPPLLKISGSTGYTTVDVTGYVLTSVDEYGNVGWQPMSGGTSGGTDTYVTGGTLNGSYQFMIGDGRNTSSWYPFDGDISDVRVYDRALSSEEIQILYKTTDPESSGRASLTSDTLYLKGEMNET